MKVCVVTSNRSEYGVLKWIMKALTDDSYFTLQLIVSGTHLSKSYGYTKNEILEDGFKIDYEIEMLIDGISKKSIVKSMGLCQIELGTVLSELNPDLLLILGDRYELLPICSSALLMGIPIAHISGGDVTEGAIDDQIRHAVTKMATIHFPGVESSASRIRQMGENPESIFTVGEPGIEGFLKANLPNRREIAESLDISCNKKWIIATFHPETVADIKLDLEVINILIDTLSAKKDFEVVFTASNSDAGGDEINFILNIASEKYENINYVYSLGQSRYLGFMKEAVLMIGNSSSGLIESPSCGLAVINIGNRQKGRIIPDNVLSVDRNEKRIVDLIEYSLSNDFQDKCKFVKNPYGDGGTSQHIIDILKITDLGHSKSLKRKFYSSAVNDF